MEIAKRKTVSLIEEIPTDGHSPMKFMCNDSDIYYCKYRVSFKEQEIDCLIYEVICSLLLQKLNLPTPEIALVEITENSYLNEDLKRNRSFISPGVICFGSKDLKNAQLVTELDKIQSKEDFELFENPDDLIRIAIFDLWVGNTDRGKGSIQYSPGPSNNYNLLTSSEEGKKKIFAFDHGFTFEGEKFYRIFNEKFPVSKNGKLFGTQFFNDVLRFIPQQRREEIVAVFIDELRTLTLEVDDLLSSIFNELPEDWKRFNGLKESITNYLKSKKRIDDLRLIAIDEIVNPTA